jgi:signal transduction histidine kinase/DNA-binding NarL/FixJ family response regulator
MKGPWLHLSTWGTRQWVIGVLALLVLTLAPLGWVQWQQFKLLNSVANNQVDAITWNTYELERELNRLGRQIERASQPGSLVSAEMLKERYDVFLSRIELLARGPRRALLEGSPAYTTAMNQLKAFVAETLPQFEQTQALLDSPERLKALTLSIDRLEPELLGLTRQASRAAARFVDERNEQLHQQGLLFITLAILQSLALLAFVAMLVRHVRQQQTQYVQLQQLSQELAVARDQAEAANHGKSVFLANMSHEIRTPFQGLLGMLNLLDESVLNRQQRDYLQTARDSALHLLGVLNDILDLSTMESGTLKLSEAPINLRGVVQEVDSLMQAATTEKGLLLTMEVSPALPTWVLADATRLRQIMFNLINNAIKFTPHGRIMVELVPPPNGRQGVCIIVRDTGLGMDSATLEQLFTRFYQADSSLRRRMGGTGLGLEISRNLTRMMGGDIAVSSEPGLGSVFTVTLPLAKAEAPALAPLAAQGQRAGRQLSVLVAEDHPVNLKYLSILLEKLGHQAVYCRNGVEALLLLQTQAFDVVLLDYHMPELDGLATTQRIRQLPYPACDVKLVLLTADVVNDTRKKALEAGVDEFVSKPLQAQDLSRCLERIVPRRPRTVASPLTEEASSADKKPGSTPTPLTSPFPMTAYEASIRLPESSVEAPEIINTNIYGEIVALMPDKGMHSLLKTLFEPPSGTLMVLLDVLQDPNATRGAIGFHAHKLKGTSLLLGFSAIARTAARIEHLANQTDDPLTPDLAQQLLSDLQATQAALRVFELNHATH